MYTDLAIFSDTETVLETAAAVRLLSLPRGRARIFVPEGSRKIDRERALLEEAGGSGVHLSLDSLDLAGASDLISSRVWSSVQAIAVVRPARANLCLGVLERTLLKHSTVPIWFWNLDDTDGPAIVVASDPDPRDPRRQSLNLEAVDLATDLALRARRTIIIANAWQLDGEDDMRNSGFLRINETEIEAARSELQAERTGRLDGLAARCRQRGVGADMELREGPVDQVMPTVVGERRASVLVAGTMKRAGIAALVRPNTVVSLADGFQGTLAVVSSGRSETESGSGRFSRIAAGTAFA